MRPDVIAAIGVALGIMWTGWNNHSKIKSDSAKEIAKAQSAARKERLNYRALFLWASQHFHHEPEISPELERAVRADMDEDDDE